MQQVARKLKVEVMCCDGLRLVVVAIWCIVVAASCVGTGMQPSDECTLPKAEVTCRTRKALPSQKGDELSLIVRRGSCKGPRTKYWDKDSRFVRVSGSGVQRTALLGCWIVWLVDPINAIRKVKPENRRCQKAADVGVALPSSRPLGVYSLICYIQAYRRCSLCHLFHSFETPTNQTINQQMPCNTALQKSLLTFFY